MNETAGQVISNNLGNTPLDFFASNSFVVMVLLGAICIIMLPFAIAGIKRIKNWVDMRFIKPKQGYIMVRQILPNDRLREFLTRPTGRFITFKTYEGKEITIPWKNEKGWVVFENLLMVIQLDQSNQQIDFSVKDIKSKIPQEELTIALKSAYETGKLIGWIDLIEPLKKLIIICLCVSVIHFIASSILSFQIMAKFDKIPLPPSAEQIAGAWLNLTAQYQTKPAINPNIPTV